MMLGASLLGTVLALAAPVSAQGAALLTEEAPYPAVAILDAFKTGCGAIENQAAASQSLTAAGWQIADPAFYPTALTQFLVFAQDAGGQAVRAQGGAMSEMEIFERDIKSERVFIVLSEVIANGARVSGCRLFDLGEERRITLEQAQDWLGREPLTVVDREGVLIADWEPGLMPGQDSFQLFFIPSDSPLKQATKFDGVALKSDTVGVIE
ncbi:MAG: hypothetical protein AAF251_18305 [Pseudomonadota bacterium]